MLRTRIIEIDEIEGVKDFYRDCAYSQPLDPSDLILAAESGDDILAVLRLSREHGVLVLRGMRVHPEHLRRGIGSVLLRFASNVIGEEICFCISHSYLSRFYSQIGFAEIETNLAPAFLGERLNRYQVEFELDVILMRRTSTPLAKQNN